MTIFETVQEGDTILIPLFLITDSWLWALILYRPLDFSCRGGTVLEAWVYPVPLLAGQELKPPFYFLQIQSPYFLFGFSGQRQPRCNPATWISDSCDWYKRNQIVNYYIILFFNLSTPSQASEQEVQHFCLKFTLALPLSVEDPRKFSELAVSF